MSKLLIRGGLIVDGTGREPFKGSVYVVGDRIETVIPSGTGQHDVFAGNETNDIIDAEGLVVAPGFIDCHSHFDWVLPLRHHQQILFPLIEQGITTVVTGNCGFSPAPVNEASKKQVHDFAEILVEEPLPHSWEGMGEFLNYLDSAAGLLFNNAQLVGHGTVHLGVVQDTARRPTGIEKVFVNGELVVDKGTYLKDRKHGRVLRAH